MKRIFKKLTNKSKLRIFSGAFSALVALQAACTPTYAGWNLLMSKLKGSSGMTVSDIEDIVEDDPSCVKETYEGKTVLYYALEKARGGEKIKIAKYLIENGAPLKVTKNENVYQWACRNGYFSFASWVLRRDECVTAWLQCHYGFSVDETAARYDCLEDMKFLYSVNPRRLLPNDAPERTPLGIAVSHNNDAVAEYLIKIGKFDGEVIEYCVREAQNNGNKHILGLLKTCVSDRTVQRFVGRKDLHQLCARPGYDADEIRALVTLGADVNAPDEKGRTPLHLAVEADCNKRNNKLVKTLLSQGGVKLNLQDKDGNTPLHLAAMMGKYNIVELLLDAGANPNIRNKQGQTPIFLAAKESNDHGKEMQDSYRCCVERLLDKGADPNIKERHGASPLNVCAVHSIRSLLKSRGAVYGFKPSLKQRAARKFVTFMCMFV